MPRRPRVHCTSIRQATNHNGAAGSIVWATFRSSGRYLFSKALPIPHALAGARNSTLRGALPKSHASPLHSNTVYRSRSSKTWSELSCTGNVSNAPAAATTMEPEAVAGSTANKHVHQSEWDAPFHVQTRHSIWGVAATYISACLLTVAGTTSGSTA